MTESPEFPILSIFIDSEEVAAAVVARLLDAAAIESVIIP
jgi:hypothetical protein